MFMTQLRDVLASKFLVHESLLLMSRENRGRSVAVTDTDC